MPHLNEERHRVRSYELDSYGHANNAAIAQWFEHGRNCLLMDHGLDYGRIEPRWGVRFVLVSSKIDYRRSLRMGEEVVIGTSVAKLGRTSTTFAQRVEVLAEDGGRTLAAECESVIVWTDLAMKGPQPVPDEFRRLYG
jgi:YbgC/YbaW family acyl-CoA thioester hydrolase